MFIKLNIFHGRTRGGANSRKRLTPSSVGDEIEEQKEKKHNHPNGIVYSDDKQESAEKESRSQYELEVGALYAAEKYSNISAVYHVFKEN
jgi:hypothetical protein